MGRGAKENSSGSLPWGRGAHREGVLLVTEMTFTESWPALQSSRAPPHTHTHSPHWPPEPLGAVFWKAVCWVRSSLASLSTASSHPDHHHSPLRKLIALRVLSSPQPGSSVAAPPQHLWETREIQPSAPPPRFPSRGQKPPRGSVRLGLGQRRRTPASLQQGPRGHTEDLCTT